MRADPAGVMSRRAGAVSETESVDLRTKKKCTPFAERSRLLSAGPRAGAPRFGRGTRRAPYRLNAYRRKCYAHKRSACPCPPLAPRPSRPVCSVAHSGSESDGRRRTHSLPARGCRLPTSQCSLPRQSSQRAALAHTRRLPRRLPRGAHPRTRGSWYPHLGF